MGTFLCGMELAVGGGPRLRGFAPLERCRLARQPPPYGGVEPPSGRAELAIRSAVLTGGKMSGRHLTPGYLQHAVGVSFRILQMPCLGVRLFHFVPLFQGWNKWNRWNRWNKAGANATLTLTPTKWRSHSAGQLPRRGNPLSDPILASPNGASLYGVAA